MAVSAVVLTSRDSSNGASVEPVIVVLPFESVGADPDQEYLTVAMFDELRRILHGIDGLQIVGRTSSLAVAGEGGGSLAAAELLDADYVLEGGLTCPDGSIRVNVDLTQAADGLSSWTETFSEPKHRVLGLPRVIAEGLAERLGLDLTAPVAATYLGTDNVAAWELYRQALSTFRSDPAGHHEEPELAVDLMRKAFLGPGYAGFFLIWHAELSEARQTESFKRLAEDLGFVELWRTTGNWGDFCAPAGVHDFECV